MGIASKLGNSNAAGPSAPPMPGGGQYPGMSQQQGGMGGAPPGYPSVGGPPQGQGGRPPASQNMLGGSSQSSMYPSMAPGGTPGSQPSGQYGAPGSQPSGQYGAPGAQQGGQYGVPPSGQGSQYPQFGAPSARPPQGQYGAPQGQPGAQNQYPGQQQQGQYGMQPQGQYGQTGGQYGGQVRPQAQFGGMPGAQGPHGVPQGMPGQQGFGGGAFSPQAIRQKLQTLVNENRLQSFYPPQRLEQLTNFVVSKDVAGLAQRWRLPHEIAVDLVGLALYDICIYVDDSGSMLFEENGERIEDLKSILSRTAEAACLFDTDGIVVRFMNGTIEGNGIHNEGEANALIQQIRFSGTTPLGSSLDRKVLQPMVLNEARRNNMQKPVLVICITDGEPTGEPKETVRQVVINAKNQLSQTQYGAGAVAFQFAQVGKDAGAHRFLEALDTDPVCGNMIDSTSYFELEQEQYARKGINLDPGVYLVKLMCGAIDRSYDEMDEG